MSSYFDEFDREVNTLSSFCGQDTELFIKQLEEAEKRLIADCAAFALDPETPQEIATQISGRIMIHRVNPEDNSEATEYARMCRRSKLSAQMHSLWHEIATLRLKTRYTGFVNDNPAFMRRLLNAYENPDSSATQES